MGFAIATQKDESGMLIYRSSTMPPPEEDMQRARKLGQYLSTRIPEIERKLKSELRAARRKKQRQGDVRMWLSLGEELKRICSEFSVNNARERQWLWEAIQNLYATDFIKKKERGKTRNHFEYCFQLAQYPRAFSEQLNWSVWSYYLDSRTVREEPRTNDWLRMKAEANQLGRQEFRRFIQKLNKRIQKLDTSVLTDQELFTLYDSVWTQVAEELKAVGKVKP